MDDDNVEEVDGKVEGGEASAPFSAEKKPQPPAYQQPYQQPYQQSYQQPYPQQYGAPQSSEPPQMILSTVFWKALWFLIIVGGILVLIGQILLDVAEYDDEGMIKAGRILGTISAFLIGVPMVVTGIYHLESKDVVRFGLILSGTLVLAFAFF